MKRFSYACTRYCAFLRRNVVMSGYYNRYGEKTMDCLNRFECDFDKLGCRNGLLSTDNSEKKMNCDIKAHENMS